MVDLSLPPCEVRISPSLLPLLAGHGVGLRSQVQRSEAACGTAPVAPVPDGPDPGGAGHGDPAAPWDRIVLRVDGQRPLRFQGALICRADACWTVPATTGAGAARVAWTLSLYLGSQAQVVAHAIGIPDEGLPARPAYRAAALTSGADLAAFLLAAHPKACFSVATEPDHVWGAQDLSFPDLAGVVCSSSSKDPIQ